MYYTKCPQCTYVLNLDTFEYAVKFFAVISHSNKASSMKHNIYVPLRMLQKYIYSAENLHIAPYNSC